MANKVCERCKEEWPSDREFYWKPGDKTCRACKYEVRLEQKKRAKQRRVPVSS